MIALNASSQTGLPATPDSLTCYTPTQNRQIAKGLTELEYARAQLALQDSVICKMQELQLRTAIELESCEQQFESTTDKLERVKRERKWWAIAGMALGVLVSAVAVE